MSELLFFEKTTAVPSVPTTANTVFLVAPPNREHHIEIYVSSKDGNAVRRHFNEDDIKALITAQMVGQSNYQIVDTIAKRDELSGVSSVYVKDATADDTVSRGGAFYLYDGTAWVKISEAESMDVALNWSDIEGRPASSAGAIDSAVANSHAHANKSQLDKFGEKDGKATYNGRFIAPMVNPLW